MAMTGKSKAHCSPESRWLV